uniref:Ig-like domain-containing protein n=1 Tax=Chrysemys picta bellii TaxID=8478 RepID=A0A8C3H9Q7_CHRPI
MLPVSAGSCSPCALSLALTSVLGSCLQPAPAQTPTPVTIVLTPPSPVVGGGVSLAPQPPPQGFVSCSWHRSATTDENSRILTYYPQTPPVQQNGSAHTGQETAGPGCALNIAGLTLSDTGNYTVQIQMRGREPRTPRWRHPSPDPVPLSVDGPDSAQIDPPGPIALTLGSLLNLMCVADSIPAPSYRWVLNGTDTKETGSSLTFNLTTWAQQRMYECRAHNPVTNRTAWASVTVRDVKGCHGPLGHLWLNHPRFPQTLQPRQSDVYEELKK